MSEQSTGGFDLDWNLVRSFVAVARAGSMAAGARQLGLAHPTVARHVQQLEESTGLHLFARTARGLVLNEAGDALFQAAAPMHLAALSLRNAMDAIGDRPVDRVRITVAELLAELLPALTPKEPSPLAETGVAVDVLVTNQSLNLLDREADIAIRHNRPTQQDLVCRRVGDVTMSAFASEAYLAGNGTLHADNALQHRLIDSYLGGEFTAVLRRNGILVKDSQVVFRSDSLACQRSAAKSGWGIGAFPTALIDASDGLFPAVEGIAPVDIPVWLVARPEVRDNRSLKSVYDAIAESLSRQLA
ncbi:MAG: LysR family transcriptional regulator [Pseudomonadales bacterium]